MNKKTMLQRMLSFVMAFAMVVTTVLTGWTPVSATENEVGVAAASATDVTLTVIGDSGNHSSDTSAHTGYIYWMKDVPLNIDVDTLSDKYVAKNAGEKVKAALANDKITVEYSDETSLYISSMTKDDVELRSDYTVGGYWSVIVAYADGTFSSDGWGEYNGAAELKPGCRLIYYWSDNIATDCRISTDDNYNATLNYDTDAVTAVTLYTEAESDSAATAATIEAGQTLQLLTRLTVPANSKVSRTLTWESSNPTVADVAENAKGAVVTAKSAGTTEIKASMINTLGEKIEVICTVSVTADGTTITGMSFEEGNELSIEPGDIAALTPVFTPALADDETAPAPLWTSSDADVASVDAETGDVEALTPGEAVITATITNNKGAQVTASCTVIVEEVAVTAIALDHDMLSMKQSATAELSIRFTPANATLIPDITWESDNETVATVIGEGTKATITAMSGGTATITAKAGDMTATCDVVVATADEIVMLQELVFANDAAGEKVYAMQSEIDPATKECTVIIPENINSVYLKPVLANGVTATIQAQYKNYNYTKDLTKDLTADTFTRFNGTSRALQSDQVARDMTLVVTAGTLTQTYTVHMIRESLVSSLNVTDASGAKLIYQPAFVNSTRAYEVTVVDTLESVNIEFTANNADSTVLTVNDQIAEGGKYTLALEGSETKAVIKAGNDTVVPAEYTLTVKRVTAGNYEFVVNPEDAVVAVYDSNSIRQWGENNKFSILPEEEYTYTISKNGYIAQTGTFVGSGTQQVTLAKAPETSYKQFESDWYGLRNDVNNQGITDAPTPTSPNSVGLMWERQYGQGYSSSAVSSQIIVDNKIYCYSADTLLVLSKETGEILKSTKMAGSSSFAINPPSYANGMIFVGLSNGRIQAFNADTLESLWIYKDALGGQPNCSIRYDNGYVYTGFWNSETKDANWVCVSVTDEDPTSATEAKAATWTYTVQGGFYWAGAYTNEDYLIVGSDDGDGGSNSETSYVYVLDKFTGKLIQKVGPCIGDIRSDISHYNGRIYFTTKAGYLYSYNLTEEGLIDTTNTITPIQPGIMSTSTPVVYNNRAYIGVTHGSNFSGTYGIVVVDIDPETGALSQAYEVPTTGYPQTSGTLTTAYEEAEGYVYVYFTVNSATGELYVVKDKDGMTEADPASGILYVPNHKQYSICSVVADKNGNIYFKNDSAYMMALTKNEVILEDAAVTGGNAAFYGEDTFNTANINHTVVVDPGTESITLSLTVGTATEVMMNGVSGAEQTIQLVNGAATVEVLLTSGEQTGSYTFEIRERSSNTDLADILVTGSTATSTAVTVLPAFDPDVKEYTGNYYKTATSLYAWARPADTNATVTAEIVSGATKIQTAASSGYQRVRVYFEDTANYETPAIVKFIVTAEDGVTTDEYFVTLGFDTELPVITMAEPAVTVRRADTATISITSNQPGTMYYVVQEDGATTPTVTNIKKGTAVAVVEGENDIVITSLTEAVSDICMVMTNHAAANTSAITVDVDAYDKTTDPYLAPELDEKIADLPETEDITLDYKDTIEELRAEYEALTDAQKEQVTKLSVLEAAEAKIVEIEEAIKAAKVLAEAKTAAKEEITDYKNADDYREAQQEELAEAIEEATAAIESAETIEAVEAAVEVAKEVMDAIKTDAQLTEEEKKAEEEAKAKALAEAKTAAKKEVAEYKDAADYREAQQEELAKAIEDATAAIELAETIEEVDAAVEEAKEVMDAIKTAEEMKLPYEDVAESDWFYESVAYTYHEGLMTGMDATHFGPYGQLSRAQFALILYRMLPEHTVSDVQSTENQGMEGSPTVDTKKSFADIVGDEWYGPAVLWAAENGIVTGYQNGNFGPADMITREQMALMMYRYANYLGNDTTAKGNYDNFLDAESVSGFAADAMKWATGEGIITGKENGTKLDPQGNTARAEAAAIIQRFIQ